MKQILLLLLLLPCLCLAQYTGNANQKITLGEQTTADGLVYRGVTNDTALITPLSDTSAYIILDTVNNKFFNYNRTTNVWSVAGGGTAVTSVATGLGLSGGPITSTGTILVDTASASIISRQRATNTFLTTTGSAANLTSFPTLNQNTTGSAATLTTSRTVQTNLATTSAASFNGSANITPGVTGVLPVANGGTNTSTAFTAGSVVFAGTSGTYAQDNAKLFYNITTNSLGVGTSTPTRRLHLINNTAGNVVMTLQNNITRISGSASYGFEIFSEGRTGSSYAFRAKNLSESKVYFTIQTDSLDVPNGNRTGFVGINTDAPTQFLHVEGNARITGAYNVTTGSAANVFVTTDGVLQRSTSSIKYKTDVEDYSRGLKEVMQLRPVTFKAINSNNDKIYAGFIAEELADLKLNELVENNDSDEPDAISYAYMVTLLTKAIQEQQEQITQLKKRLLTLENK